MNRSFPDLRPCPGATLLDLDMEKVEAYSEQVGLRRPESRVLRASVEEQLILIGAVLREDNVQPTLAGILLFGKDPQWFYPSFTITFLHFPGASAASGDSQGPLYLDNREFRGTLPAMIDAARDAVLGKLSRHAVVNGFVRRDLLEYPEIAFREAIVNAVAHRDYGLEGSFVQVRLFSDRLEVQSPGGLGGHLTVENIAYEQYARNPYIVRLLEDHGYVERRGLGVDNMMRAMVDAGRELPLFEDRGSSFWVTLRGRQPVRPRRDLVRLGLNDRQVRAVDYLEENSRLTNREYQALFDVAERTALYDLQGLVDAGIALPVSSGRGRYYILRD
jgi:ATP-dependent DNA helicase RecG